MAAPAKRAAERGESLDWKKKRNERSPWLVVGRGRLKCRHNFGRRGRSFEGFCLGPVASGMMLCNSIPDGRREIVIGFVAGGIREGISAPAFVVAVDVYVCDFQLLAAAVPPSPPRCRPIRASPSFPFSLVRQPVSQSNCRRR